MEPTKAGLRNCMQYSVVLSLAVAPLQSGLRSDEAKILQINYAPASALETFGVPDSPVRISILLIRTKYC